MHVNNMNYRDLEDAQDITKFNLELLQENSNQRRKNIAFIIW